MLKNAVILAAGRSSRFGSNKLTENICGITLPQRTLKFCYDNGIENVYVTINRNDVMSDESNIGITHPIIEDLNFANKVLCKDSLNIYFVFQDDNEYGPAAAIKPWKDKIDGPFITLFGDNLYMGKISNLCIDDGEDAIVSFKDNTVDARNLQLATIVDGCIVEKPHGVLSGRYFCGYVIFNESVWNNIEKIEKSGRNEYEITDLINSLYHISFHKIDFTWTDITFKSDIAKITEIIEGYKG